MDYLIALLIMASPIALIITLLCWYSAWRCGNQYLSFNKFIEYYNINPDKWSLYKHHVSIYQAKSYLNTPYAQYRFGPIGYYRYLFWRHNLENQKLAAMFEDKENKNETSI